MAYDAQAESLRLIEHGLPGGPVRLSRRRRFAPLAVDVDGDVAATRFVRRGVACFWDETHLLERHRSGAWHVLGGGGASSHDPWTAEAFRAERDAVAPGALATRGGASVRRDSRRTPWVRSAEVLAGPGVTVVRVADRRELLVPEHGRLVVVWASHRPPRLSTPDGFTLVPDDRAAPAWYTDR
ncbi:ferrous iron transport protein A [Actinoplanes sp. URMC 104]|uniref:ferrous iron transport protein A n=1 Tax=Actinoplanes sp. URMC 104 TaxID=3423409 RepID=UPI003F1A2DDD